MTEQQQHLQNLMNQRNSLQKELDSLRMQMENKKELFFKIQGAIEYLTQIGVTLAEVDKPAEDQLPTG